MKALIQIDALWQSGTLQYLLGRSPPPRDPLPHKPARPSGREEREPPKAPKAMRNDEGRPRAETNGRARAHEEPPKAPKAMLAEKANRNGIKIAGTAKRSKTSSVEPVIVLDSSNDSHHQKSSKAKLEASTLQLDEAESPISVRDDDDEDGGADSKYATHQDNHKRKKKASRLDEFGKVAPKTFVIDDSASEDDRASSVDGEAVETAPKRQKTISKEDEEKRRKRKEYWESKGNAATEISSDESGRN